MPIEYFSGTRGAPGFLTTFTGSSGTVHKAVIPAVINVDAAGNPVSGGGGAGGSTTLPATTDRSGTATTTSGGLTVPANSARTFLVGQNLGTVNIGFNEQGGTAAIGSVGTYTVPPGSSFSISSNKAVNFIAASGSVPVTMTEG